MAIDILSLVPREQMQSMLSSLHAVCGLPVRLVDAQQQLLFHYGLTPVFCDLLTRRLSACAHCTEQLTRAGRQAQNLGEAYIFSCPCQLTHIAFPLFQGQELLSTVIVGPFLMDEPDSSLLTELADSSPMDLPFCLELSDELHRLPLLPPDRVQPLSKLIFHLFAPLLPDARAQLLTQNQKLYQQSRINESIQRFKGNETPPQQSFFFAKEDALLLRVKTGNTEEAKALLNELLGYVFFSEGGNMEAIRARGVGLTELLGRVSAEGGAGEESIYQLSRHFQALILDSKSLEDLCYLLQDVVESFMSAMFNRMDQGNPHIRRALQLIATRYAEPLTLETVSHAVQLSPSYFSDLFQKTTGRSFREHLCRVRVEESCHLLLNTDATLASIAVDTGFADQSSYCKAFRRILGLSPGQYRKQK